MDRATASDQLLKLDFQLEFLDLVKGSNITGVLFGLNILAISVQAAYKFYDQGVLFPIGVSILMVNIATGILLIIRTPFAYHRDIVRKPYWLMSLLFNGALFKCVQPISAWPLLPQIIFTLAAIYTVVSLIFLGRSFSVVPAPMPLVVSGTYSMVRHPVYLGEMLMAGACVCASLSILSVGTMVGLSLSQFARIREEEKVLAQSNQYDTYIHTVRWRLVPGLW